MDNDTLTMIDNASPEELDKLLEEHANPENPEADSQADANDSQETQTQKPDAAPEKSVEDRLKELEADRERYQKQLKDKEDFIQQRNAEVGLLRKQLRDRRTAEAQAEITDEEILENPKEAVKKAIERAREKEQLENEQRQEAIEEMRRANTEALKTMVPDFEQKRETILSVLQSEAPKEIVEAFKADPTATLHPSLIFQLAKRAEASLEIQKLRAQVEELKQKPTKLIENITKHSQAKSPVAAAQQSAPKASRRLDNVTARDIDSMSLEELAELEKQLMNQ